MCENCTCEKYPKPSVTADIIVRRKNIHGLIQYLFVVRKNEPYKDQFALPGGFLNENETGTECAIRELKEETGLSLLPSQLNIVHVADEKGRDPRGWTISLVHKCDLVLTMEDSTYLKASDDAKDLKWLERDFVISNPELFAFDHVEILKKVY